MPSLAGGVGPRKISLRKILGETGDVNTRIGEPQPIGTIFPRVTIAATDKC